MFIIALFNRKRERKKARETMIWSEINNERAKNCSKFTKSGHVEKVLKGRKKKQCSPFQQIHCHDKVDKKE